MADSREFPRVHAQVAGPASEGPIRARTVFSLTEQETIEFGQVFARGLQGGELVLLHGDLGAGKTVFVRGVAQGLGVPDDAVRSPSYTLINEYTGGRFPMFHLDLYRVEEPESLGELGLEELLDSRAVVLVEWGDRLPPFYTRRALKVRLHDIGEGSRRIEVQPAPRRPARHRGDA